MLRKISILLTLLAMMALTASLIAGVQAPPAQGGQAPEGAGGRGGGRGQGAGGPGGQGGRGGGGGGGAAQAIKPVPGKTGLYMVTGAGGNSTVRVTNEGIVVVDTKNLGEANYNALMDQIKTVSQAPVRFAVITHVHQDHSGNSEWFMKAGAQVVAHENLKQNLETYNPAQGKPATPNVLYAKDYSIKLGGTEVQVHHFAAGHTSGDSLVYFPDLKVVAFGDELSSNPNCDYAQGGSVPEWAKSFEAVLKLDFDMAIPGHGNDPMTRADVEAFKNRLDGITKHAIDLVKKGTPKDQLMAQIAAADASLNAAQLINAMRLDAFYDEITRLAR